MSEYKRLTKWEMNKGVKCVKYWQYSQEQIAERLALLEDKIENKTLIELPCKVGDSFYGIEPNTIFKYSVLAIKILENNAIILCTVYDIEFVLGKDCFLTKAEAEARLKELQEIQK